MLLAQQLINGLLASGIYALFAVGFAMVFGVMNVLNMTHADFAMVAAVTIALLVGMGFSPVLVFPAAALVVIVLAILVERVAIRPAQGARGEAAVEMPLIATIGASMIVQNCASLLVGNRPVTFPYWYIGYLEIGGLQISKALLISAVCAAGLLVLLELLMESTDFGRQARAVAQNRNSALIMGINASRVLVIVLLITALLSGIAGCLVGMSYGFISPFIGLSLAIKGLIAMIIGGVGSLRGAVVGAVMLGVVESLAILYFGSTVRDFAVFVVLMAVLIIKPSGLITAKSRR
jgi:branched-chain amino acid transport system permease protein